MEAKPQRIQLSRLYGFRLQVHSQNQNGLSAVKIDRTTPWGNPYPITIERTREHSVEAFRHHVLQTPMFVQGIRMYLRGKNVACWCALCLPCHGDILLAVANSEGDVKLVLGEAVAGVPVSVAPLYAGLKPCAAYRPAHVRLKKAGLSRAERRLA